MFRKYQINIKQRYIQLPRFQIYPETELACKYNTSFYKTQYSKTLAKYGKDFDMNTGKLIFKPNPTHHISNSNERSYIPITFLKTQEELVENFDHKSKAVHAYKNYHL